MKPIVININTLLGTVEIKGQMDDSTKELEEKVQDTLIRALASEVVIKPISPKRIMIAKEYFNESLAGQTYSVSVIRIFGVQIFRKSLKHPKSGEEFLLPG